MRFYVPFLLLIVATLLFASLFVEAKSKEHLESLLAISTAGGGNFHPSKDEIVFVSNKPGVLQLYTVKFSREDPSKRFKPRRLTNTENRCTSPSYMSNGDVVFMHDRGGDEDFQIGLIKNSKITYLTHHLKAKNTLNQFTKNYMYYVSNFENKKKFGLYRKRMPATKGNSDAELIYMPKKGIARLNALLFNEQVAILSQHYSNVASELIWYNIADGTTASLTAALSGSKPTRWSGGRWLNKEHTKMIVHTDFQSDFIRPAILELTFAENKFDPPTVQFTAISEIDDLNHDVTNDHHVPATGQTYLEVNRDGYTALYRTVIGENGVESPLVEVQLPLDNSVVVHGDTRSFGRGISFSRDGQFAAVTLTSSAVPTTMWLIDLRDSSDVAPNGYQILSSEMPDGVDASEFVGENLQEIKSFDGVRVPYFMFYPKQTASMKKPANGWPTIIQLHGGPESQSLPTFSPVRQFLLSAGYAIAVPNIRGSKGYGRTYLDMDNQNKRLDAIKDIQQIGLRLAANNAVDAKKIVVMGGSYGGYATLMSLVEYPAMWKAGVDIVGMSNLETFLQHTAAWRRSLREPEYGSLETQKKLLKRISPINYVDRIQAPLFMIMGANDERVPVEEAQQVNDQLKANGQEVQLMVFKDEGHGLSKLKNRIKAFTTLLAWLNKNVVEDN